MPAVENNAPEVGAVTRARAFFARVGGRYAEAVYVALADMRDDDPEAVEYAEHKLAEWRS